MSTFGERLWISMPLPALLLDPGDLISEINAEAEGFLNASARSLRGAPLFERLAIDAPLEEAFARARKNRAPLFINTVDVGTGSKPPEPCDLQIAPMIGMPGFLLLLMTPRQLAGRLSRAGVARSSARSAIGMAEMLAHEIKNPLAGITGAAQLLAMGLDGGDRELTDLIVAESRRIVALLDQVEQFGNLQLPKRQVMNIHDVLTRALRTAALGFAAHMKIVEEYDPSLPMTHVDGDQMQQVFLNLIRNATEAAGKTGGTIRARTFYDHGLRLRRADGSGHPLPLQIEISDDGPGLPPDLAEIIFDPFVSGRENGTGLGLALVSKIVAEHEGLIDVESYPGHTAFRISLPLAPAEIAKEKD
ncbi:two-component system nitrogen regulation sensor histidine kinase GlnL [Palleronia aestuarii]|uniref:histidine kinase n=1 Tax=Palleronia aestuarii TaxID=568105 RepID=A0A2W7NP76_9RHOB|nr:ATP-binding protein [Palleronia aestuarii]PZX19947.1 two-component system nitrogen regulation sensor histidine kinase GlnL [Palleronia aestuarii]